MEVVEHGNLQSTNPSIDNWGGLPRAPRPGCGGAAVWEGAVGPPRLDLGKSQELLLGGVPG